MIARPADFFSQARKHSEKTKNGQATTRPHAGAANECSTPQNTAEFKYTLHQYDSPTSVDRRWFWPAFPEGLGNAAIR